jgi:DNA mismatch endonuclease (patch repair protein)
MVWNKGLSVETDIRLKNLGKKLSKIFKEEYKSGKRIPNCEMISKKTKEAMWRPEVRKKMLEGIKKRKNKPENLGKWSKKGHKIPNSVKKKWKRNGKYNSMYGKHHTDKTKEMIRKKRLKRQLPKENTNIEILIFTELKKRKIKYYPHKTILNITQPDAFIRPNICIYCDGNYWHNYPNGTERDKKINKILKDNNYIVFRFWGSEIKKNVKECVDIIEEEVRNENAKLTKSGMAC